MNKALINLKILIIGKKSFIGSHLFSYFKKKSLYARILNYDDLKKKNQSYLKKFDYLVNCTTNKKYVHKKYDLSNDFDLLIAKKIINTNINLIHLSTRKVYKPKYNIRENTILKPICNYSLNKSITEKQLSKILNKRLTILRISNLIGLPLNNINKKLHYTFMDHFFYNIHKGIIYKNGKNFKDFISIDKFCEITHQIMKKKLSGIYNVSIGKKIFLSTLIKWLNHFNNKPFKYKTLEKKYNKDCFTLNNERLMKDIKLKNRIIDLKNYSKKISKKYFKNS